MKIRITKDNSEWYAVGKEMDATEFINDYISDLNPETDNDDKELYDHIKSLSVEDAVKFIALGWDVDYEII